MEHLRICFINLLMHNAITKRETLPVNQSNLNPCILIQKSIGHVYEYVKMSCWF